MSHVCRKCKEGEAQVNGFCYDCFEEKYGDKAEHLKVKLAKMARKAVKGKEGGK